MSLKKMNLHSLSARPNLFLFCEYDQMREEQLGQLKDMLNSMPVPEEFAGVDAALLHAALLLVVDGRLPLEHAPDFIAKTCHLLGYPLKEDADTLACRIFDLVAGP